MDDIILSSSAGLSESSTILDSDEEFPQHGRPFAGDATPRAPLSTLISRIDPSQTVIHRESPVGEPRPTAGHGPTNLVRQLVPFQPESELWPYPTHDEGGGDIVELDFGDMSVLNDPEGLRRVTEKSQDVAPLPQVNGRIKTKGKGKGKDRAAEKQRQMQEIEKSWDNPQPVGQGSGPVGVNAQAAAASIIHSVMQRPVRSAIGRNDFIREILTLIHVSRMSFFYVQS